MQWVARYGLPILITLSLCGCIAHTETESICKEAGEEGILLHIDGSYAGYPYSVLRHAVLQSVSCPVSATELRAFHAIAVPAPHMRVSIKRPVEQGRLGALSVVLFSQGRFVIGERMALTSFSRTQSPSSIKGDINLATVNLWNDLASRITHNKPIIP